MNAQISAGDTAWILVFYSLDVGTEIKIRNFVCFNNVYINGITKTIVPTLYIHKNFVESFSKFVCGNIEQFYFFSVFQKAMASQYSKETNNNSKCKSRIFAKKYFPLVSDDISICYCYTVILLPQSIK